MATPSGHFTGVGFRNFRIFELDQETGYPKAVSMTPYIGMRVSGAKAMRINHPEPRLIVHSGDDRVFALDTLPPTDVVTGEIMLAKISQQFDAVVTGVKIRTVGEASQQLIATDNQGNESLVGIMAYQQGTEEIETPSASKGARRWHYAFLPKAWVILRMPGQDENPVNPAYSIRPQICRAHLWGEPFAVSADGATESPLIHGVTVYKPMFTAWIADGNSTEFLFDADYQAVNAGKIHIVANAGVEVVGGFTPDVTGITFDTKPDQGNFIACFYEVA